MNTVFFHEISPSCNNVVAPPHNSSRHQPSVLFFDNCEDPIPPELSPTLSLKEDSRTHSLWRILQLLQRIEVLRLCALPAAVVLQQFLRFTNSKTLLSLRTPCMAPVPNLHSCENEKRVISPELAEMNSDLCQRTPCGQTSLHSLQEFYSLRQRNN
jgi:hypothetical protein